MRASAKYAALALHKQKEAAGASHIAKCACAIASCQRQTRLMRPRARVLVAQLCGQFTSFGRVLRHRQLSTSDRVKRPRARVLAVPLCGLFTSFGRVRAVTTTSDRYDVDEAAEALEVGWIARVERKPG